MNNLRKEHGFIDKFKVWFGNDSVIVFTMGKVGTLTICNSLDRVNIKHVHPHSLRYTQPGIHFLKNVNLSFLRKIFYFYKTISKRLKVNLWLGLSKEIIIITGVRDPFSRAISAFFEQSHYLGIDPDNMDYQKTYKEFLNYYDLEGTANWFDNEINETFNIDIYLEKFDREKGFQVINKGKVRMFIYRIDKLNSLEKELQLFIGNKKMVLESTNITNPSTNYTTLKSQYLYSTKEFESISKTRYLQHFYTSEEIGSLKKRWT